MVRSHRFVPGSAVLAVALFALACGGEGDGSKAGGSSGAEATAGVGNAAGSEAGGGFQETGSAQGGQAGGGAQEPGRAQGGNGSGLPDSNEGARRDEAGGAVIAAGAGSQDGDVGRAGAGGSSNDVPGPDAAAATSIVGLWEGTYVQDGRPDSSAVPGQAIIDPDHNVYLGLDHFRGRGIGTVSATGDLVVTVTGTAGSTLTYTGHVEGDSGSGTWSDVGGGRTVTGTWSVTRREGVTVDAGTRAVCDGPCWTNSDSDAASDPSALVICMFVHVAPSPAAKLLMDRLSSCDAGTDCDALFDCFAAGSLADVYVSTSGNDTNSGATPVQAKRTLNAAISVTQTDGTVHIAGGTYAETVLISRPVTLQGGYDAEFTRIDPVASPTKIDGGARDSTITVFLPTPSSARLALKSLNVINGLTDGMLGVSGGGLRIVTGPIEQLDIEDCTFSANRAVGSGGGLQVNDATLTVTACTFVGNTAGDSGGGLQVNDGTLAATGCTLEGNVAEGNGGGAIDANRSTVTVTDTTIRSNQTLNYGGGIHVWECEATTDGCIITDNQAGKNGGGIYFSSGSDETYAVKDTTATGNVPNQIGGSYADLGGNTLGEDATSPQNEPIPEGESSG
ncbi:MAG: hypothetical protein JW940_23850 [Polyangiaceae bacterium]|nr:hypothetical protein [Polyangiaceae bacterium]